MIALILKIVQIKFPKQRVIYLKYLRSRWRDTPSWPFLDTYQRKMWNNHRGARDKKFLHTLLKHLQKFGQQWLSMVILVCLCIFRIIKSKLQSKFPRNGGQCTRESNISVYKLCNATTESFSVTSNPATAYCFVTTTYWTTVG